MAKEREKKEIKELEVKSFNTANVVYQNYGQRNIKPAFNPVLAKSVKSGYVSAICDINNNQLAGMQLKLYAQEQGGKEKLYKSKKVKGKKLRYLKGLADYSPSVNVVSKANDLDVIEEIYESHPLLTLITPTIISQIVDDLQTFGNALFLKYFDEETGAVTLLENLDFAQIEVVPNTDKTAIEGYKFGSRKEAVVFPPENVLHFRFAEGNKFWGRGCVEKAWDIINVNDSQHKALQAFYDNGAFPGVIWSIEDGTKRQIGEIDNFLSDNLKGPKNQNKQVVMPKGITPHIITPPNVAQLAVGSKALLTELAVVFGVPVSKVLGNDIKSNSQQHHFAWLSSTILHFSRIIEDVFNSQLLPDFGLEDEAFLSFDNPVPEDTEKNLSLDNNQKDNVTRGLITTNEYRESIGLEPVEGGDVLRVNGIRLDTPAPVAPALPTEEQAEEPIVINNNLTQPDNVLDLLGNLVEQMNSLSASINNQAEQVEEKELEVDQGETRVGLFLDSLDTKAEDENTEKGIRKVFASYFEKQEEALINLLSAKKYNPDIQTKDISDSELQTTLTKFSEELYEELNPLTKRAIEAGAIDGLESIGFAPDIFDVNNNKVSTYIAKKNIRLAGEVNQVTLEKLSKTLSEGFENGESVGQLTKRIQESAGFSRERSEKIARTETADSFVQGERMGWTETGEVSKVKWLISPNACPECVELSNKEIDLVGEDFTETDYRDIDGPPLHPNCRCDILPILK